MNGVEKTLVVVSPNLDLISTSYGVALGTRQLDSCVENRGQEPLSLGFSEWSDGIARVFQELVKQSHAMPVGRGVAGREALHPGEGELVDELGVGIEA